MKRDATPSPPWLLWLVLSVAAGCDQAPPFDELPLRDALRADPAAIAALSDSARSSLAARLQAAGTADHSADVVELTDSPAAAVASLDGGRDRRQADALVVGALAADGTVRAFGTDSRATSKADPTPLPALPPLEGEAASTTALFEARALDGTAGVTLRQVMAQASARRLVRVVGWPVGAIALADTVYVDAAWLVALAPSFTEGGTATALAGPTLASSASPLRSAITAAAGDGTMRSDAGREAPDAGAPPSDAATMTVDADPAADASAGPDATLPYFDASVPTFVVDSGTPPSPSPPSSGPTFVDACGAGADTCASSDDSCDDQDDDSCSGSDGSDNSCDAPPDDDSNCRVAPGRARRRSTLLWVLGPLAFLLKRRP